MERSEIVSRISALEAELAAQKAIDSGGKIQINGVFGKLGSAFSVLYAPQLLISVTLTGQLALLMLIERAECAGINVVSANTDGVVFRCPAHREHDLNEIKKQWERDTGFELEATRYKSLHNLSVNTYFAVKPNGKVKRKGILANPWSDPTAIRERLMKNPQMTICSDAALQFILDGTPIEDTIRACTDFTQFITVVNVKGGGIWGGKEIPSKPKPRKGEQEISQEDYEESFGLADFDYLGKVVRYYWGRNGGPIYYKTPHESTGNFKKVSKTDGCRPAMELPEQFPADIDYARYIAEANEILRSVGVGVDQPAVDVAHIFNFLVI